jgi:hypothetical protein
VRVDYDPAAGAPFPVEILDAEIDCAGRRLTIHGGEHFNSEGKSQGLERYASAFAPQSIIPGTGEAVIAQKHC